MYKQNYDKCVRQLNQKIEDTKTDCYYNFGFTNDYSDNNFLHEYIMKLCLNYAQLPRNGKPGFPYVYSEYQKKRLDKDYEIKARN